jgi:hypothetical protein
MLASWTEPLMEDGDLRGGLSYRGSQSVDGKRIGRSVADRPFVVRVQWGYRGRGSARVNGSDSSGCNHDGCLGYFVSLDCFAVRA